MSGTKLLSAAPLEPLHAELRDLIAASRQRLATEVLGGERAQYGAQLMDRLGERLAQEFGRGFEVKNLRRMVQFAQSFAEEAIVATLSRQLSWSHVVALLPLKSVEARLNYGEQAALEHWSVRELRALLDESRENPDLALEEILPDDEENGVEVRV